MRTDYKIWTITTLVSFVLIFGSLISIKNTPTVGYETSNYLATPLIFWIAIASGIFNGVYLIICNIYNEKRKIWILGFFEILFCQSLLLLLYSLRGYLYLDRGDAFSYVGMMKDVSIHGSFMLNFYPIVSILGSEISQVTNLSTLSVSRYLPTFFFITFQLSIYCWAKSLLFSKKFILCTMISSIPFFFAYFSTTIYHMTLAVFMLPLFFYLLKKREDPRFIFLVIILLLMYPFFHPIVSFFVILYLIVLLISEKILYDIDLKNASFSLFLIGTISLTSWFIFQNTLFHEFSLVLLQLFNMYDTETSLVVTQRYASSIWTIDYIKHIFVPFYDDFIYYTLFLISTCVIIFKKNIFNRKNLLEVIIYFIIGSLALGFLFITSRIHNPIRLLTLNQNILFTLPIVGYLLYYFVNNKVNSKFLIVTCLILIAQFTSMLSIYQSAICMLPNDQTTISEIEGMNWLISTKNTNYSNSDIMSPVFRYSDLIYGHYYTTTRKDLIYRGNLDDHFGIPNNYSTNNLTFPIKKDEYLVITNYDIQAYTNIWKIINRYNKEDFAKINSCKNIDKIYSNEAVTINLIHKVKG